MEHPSVLVASLGFANSMRGVSLLREKSEIAVFTKGLMNFTGERENITAIVLGDEPCGREVMSFYPNLKTIARFGTGYNNVDVEAAREKSIVVTRVSSASAPLIAEGVSEYALGLIIALSRNILYSHDLFIYQNKWSEARITGRLLLELTVGIVGIGAIGAAIARKLHLLGVGKLIGYNRTPRNKVFEVAEECRMKLTNLADVFWRSDVIVLSLALTPETRGIISREILFRLNPQALLVNIARGALVDEAALVERLEKDRIGGVALDVFSSEPPFKEPFFKRLQDIMLRHRNVILTPHEAPLSRAAIEQVSERTALNVIAVLEGRQDDGVEIVSV